MAVYPTQLAPSTLMGINKMLPQDVSNISTADLALCKFCTSSREWMVERSIIIDPSEGSYLMRSERYGNVFDKASSVYLSTAAKEQTA